MNLGQKNKSYNLDIIIPVYNEGENILQILESLDTFVKTPFRILICYDHDDDNTLLAIRNNKRFRFQIMEVKNRGEGPHGAVVTGFEQSTAPAVIVFPSDDTFNAPIIDLMYEKFKEGSDIVVASRFMEGGCMKGCPRLKALLVRTASFTLHHFAKIPIRDSTSGFKLFSRRVIDNIYMESTKGFTYSLELVVKCHRLHWKIDEIPAQWHERTKGKSRFRVFRWFFPYMRWYVFGFMTTFFKMKPETILFKKK